MPITSVIMGENNNEDAWCGRKGVFFLFTWWAFFERRWVRKGSLYDLM